MGVQSRLLLTAEAEVGLEQVESQEPMVAQEEFQAVVEAREPLVALRTVEGAVTADCLVHPLGPAARYRLSAGSSSWKPTP